MLPKRDNSCLCAEILQRLCQQIERWNAKPLTLLVRTNWTLIRFSLSEAISKININSN